MTDQTDTAVAQALAPTVEAAAETGEPAIAFTLKVSDVRELVKNFPNPPTEVRIAIAVGDGLRKSLADYDAKINGEAQAAAQAEDARRAAAAAAATSPPL